ncbi:DUF3027 domain-containing protein [Agromyces sp. H3Y2-19a]|uniref:DUF3027 domain-containing protein n=1 Tax=Agromyces TaxID=33877 RepID=UPI001E36E7ED|nr:MULTISPECIES: DUF3027 domain-containing protein [Agromyces]MCD5346441.1 DUF3027 domain-containing protein [Agromyces sp. S2-1-8]MDF0512805.1 DUF3027 domain-containing protein [Agromyces chromiiresistens]
MPEPREPDTADDEVVPATATDDVVAETTTEHDAAPALVADEVLLASASLAQRALLEVTAPETVGSVVGHIAEGEHVLTLQFAADLAGYPGWHWSVTIARVDDAEPTVLETELMPGEHALLAPEWVPWSERLAEYRAVQAAAAAEAAGADDDEYDETSADDEIDDDEGLDDGEGDDHDEDDEDDGLDEGLEADDDFDGIDIDALDDGDDDEGDHDDDAGQVDGDDPSPEVDAAQAPESETPAGD